MQTKWYHYPENNSLTIWFSIISIVPIMSMVLLIVYVLKSESVSIPIFLLLVGLLFFFSLVSTLIIYVTIFTTPIAAGINDENLIIKPIVGEILIPWESITHFYPLYRWRFLPKWKTSWGISSPHLPK